MKIYYQREKLYGVKAPRGFGKMLKKAPKKDVGIFKNEPFQGVEITAEPKRKRIDPIELTYTYSTNDLLEKAFCDGYEYALEEREFGKLDLALAKKMYPEYNGDPAFLKRHFRFWRAKNDFNKFGGDDINSKITLRGWRAAKKKGRVIHAGGFLESPYEK